MLEVQGNLWDYWGAVNWVAITTNGDVNRLGEAVMGRGIALQARYRFPHLPAFFGSLLREKGNNVMVFSTIRIMTFPTKHHWRELSDIALIERSAKQVVEVLDSSLPNTPSVLYLPRPGCGNGGLKWSTVKPILETILDDRFTIVNDGGKNGKQD